MEKKNNSAINQKYINNNLILNLKSSSQRINNYNYGRQQKLKNNIDRDSNIILNNISQNHLTNFSLNEKSSTSNINTNHKSDDFSLDNISNIIGKDKNLPHTQMILEDNNSSLIDKNTNQNKSNFMKVLTNLSDTKILSNNDTKEYDSHTKSFQMKMKKMREMNKTIIKENYNVKNRGMNDSNKSQNIKYNYLDNSKSIINCKQKINSMKNKNKLIWKIGDLKEFNIHLNDIHNNKKSENKANNINNCFCCYGKYKI
jgi:hypothetical protein